MDGARAGQQRPGQPQDVRSVHIGAQRYLLTRSGAVVDSRFRPQPAEVRSAVYRAVAQHRIQAPLSGAHERCTIAELLEVAREALSSGGDLQRALRCAREAVCREADDGEGAALLSEVLRAQLKVEEALSVTERFADGEYVPALLARAAVLIDLGREAQARPLVERAARLVK